MKTCYSVSIIVLAFLLGARAERPRKVIAAIPNETFLPSVPKLDDEVVRPTTNLEVTGFITKNGDIFELSESAGMGSIQSRQEPDLEPGVTMCRYGTIVVYSDVDCNTFFKSSQNQEAPVKTVEKEDPSEGEETEEKPLKQKKKTKVSRRKPSKRKVQGPRKTKKNKRRKNQLRKKAIKQRGTKNRRPNDSKQKVRKNIKKKNKQRTQRRGNSKEKRRKISSSETRSLLNRLQFTMVYDRQ